ncbi:MAG: hypothetical protein CMB31_04245 [Euryarchaeota archaeon]|nr:hypothetical protein [Euryarchaeota archaeon]
MDLIIDGLESVPGELGMGFGKRKLKMTKSAIAARRAYRRRTRGSPKRRRRKSPVRRRKSPKVNRVYKGCPGSRTCSETEKYIDMLEGRVTVNSQKANRLERELQNLKSKDINDAKKLAAVKKLQKNIRARNEKRSKLARDAEDDFDAYSAVWGSSFGKRKLKMTKSAIAARRAYRRRTRGSPKRRRRKSPKRRRSPVRRRRSPVRRRRSPVRRRRTTLSQRTYGNVPLSIQEDDSDLSVFGGPMYDRMRARARSLKTSLYNRARSLKNRLSPRRSRYGRRLKMTKSAIAARRAYRRRNSPRRRRRSPIRRRRVSPRRGRKMSKRTIYANAKKAMRLHHRTGISLKAAWRKVLGNKRSRFGEDFEDILGLSEFGMATVCRPGYSPNRRWRAGKGRGQKRCVKDKTKKITLKELQAIARKNGVEIYKARKGGSGYTKTPVTAKALKARLSRAKVSYNYGRSKSPGISYV